MWDTEKCIILSLVDFEGETIFSKDVFQWRAMYWLQAQIHGIHHGDPEQICTVKMFNLNAPSDFESILDWMSREYNLNLLYVACN